MRRLFSSVIDIRLIASSRVVALCIAAACRVTASVVRALALDAVQGAIGVKLIASYGQVCVVE